MSVRTSDRAVRFSYCMLPDYSLADSIEMIKVADELDYYACYSVDETWHKQPIFDAFAAGDVAKAIELFSPEHAEKLSVAGTPEECAEQIERDIIPAGINHVVLALADAPLVEFFSGQSIADVPPIKEQLRLVADRMMPAFV